MSIVSFLGTLVAVDGLLLLFVVAEWGLLERWLKSKGILGYKGSFFFNISNHVVYYSFCVENVCMTISKRKWGAIQEHFLKKWIVKNFKFFAVFFFFLYLYIKRLQSLINEFSKNSSSIFDFFIFNKVKKCYPLKLIKNENKLTENS